MALSFSANPQTSRACDAKMDSFTTAKPIATLPPGERSSIMTTLSPEIRAFQKIGGGDETELRPERLSRLLHYTAVGIANPAYRLIVVRLVDQTCGAHFNCVAFVLKLDSMGATNVLKGRDAALPHSPGGADFLGVLPRAESNYPDLLFASHISAFESAVSCFTWQSGRYVYTPCTPECAHFLDRPRP